MRLWQGTPLDPAIKGAWAPFLNTNDALIDSATNGTSTISLTGLTTYSLTVANGAADQAREAAQNFTGALSAACTVTLPNVPKIGWAINNTTGGFGVTLTSGAGTQATVPADGFWHLYWADGSGNVVMPTLAGTPSALTGSSLNIAGAGTVTGKMTVGSLALGTETVLTTTGIASTLAVDSATIGTATISQATIPLIGRLVVGTGGTQQGVLSTVTMNPAGNSIIVNSVPVPAQNFTAFVANLGKIGCNFGVWEFSGGIIGSITTTNGTTTVYNTTSDQTLKIWDHDFDAEQSGSIIDRLRAVWFRWKSNAEAEPEPGFFAQQAWKAFKWAVTPGHGKHGDDEDFVPWQMDAAKLMPVVIAELQSLRARVKELEAKAG